MTPVVQQAGEPTEIALKALREIRSLGRSPWVGDEERVEKIMAICTVAIDDLASRPQQPQAETPLTDEPAEALQKLLECCDASDDSQYGTLSSSLVRELVNEAIAAARAHPPEAVSREDFDKMSSDLTRAKNLLVRLHSKFPEARSQIEGSTGTWFIWGTDRDAAHPPEAEPTRLDVWHITNGYGQPLKVESICRNEDGSLQVLVSGQANWTDLSNLAFKAAIDAEPAEPMRRQAFMGGAKWMSQFVVASPPEARADAQRYYRVGPIALTASPLPPEAQEPKT